MWPPPPPQIGTNRDPVPQAPAPVLLTAPAAAAALSISERTFHALRKRKDFPSGATVVFGRRCVRFRLDALRAFATSLVTVTLSEPKTAAREPRRSLGETSPCEGGARSSKL